MYRRVFAACLACTAIVVSGCAERGPVSPASSPQAAATIETRLSAYLESVTIVYEPGTMADTESPVPDDALRAEVASRYDASVLIREALAIHYLKYAARQWRMHLPTDQSASDSMLALFKRNEQISEEQGVSILRVVHHLEKNPERFGNSARFRAALSDAIAARSAFDQAMTPKDD